MIIVGAKGFAKEVLEVLYQIDKTKEIVFFDDINIESSDLLYNKYKVLKSIDEVKLYFKNNSNEFTLGIGNPILRAKLYTKFKKLGGIFVSTISPLANIGNFGNEIKEGCNIMTGTIITNDVKIGKGVLINLNCTIGHDSIIEDFVEISPNVSISGNCFIGKYSNIGTNATILPKIKIGENVIIGAGSVVNKDIPSNTLVVGVPAKAIKTLEPLIYE